MKRRDHDFERMNAYDAAQNSILTERFLRACSEPMDGARAEWAYSFGMLIAKKEQTRLADLIRYVERFTEPRQRAILRRVYLLKNDHLFRIGKASADAEIAAAKGGPS